jgi:hypothetical protein
MAMTRSAFGKVPRYLKTVKTKIAHERAIVEEFHQRMEQVCVCFLKLCTFVCVFSETVCVFVCVCFLLELFVCVCVFWNCLCVCVLQRTVCMCVFVCVSWKRGVLLNLKGRGNKKVLLLILSPRRQFDMYLTAAVQVLNF